MSSRERWTVYPLLLLSIGLALRAVLVPPDRLEVGTVEANRVLCGEIVVSDDSGEVKLVHIGRVKGGGGGRIEVNDREGLESVAIGTSADGREGAVEFFDADGITTGRLTAEGGIEAAADATADPEDKPAPAVRESRPAVRPRAPVQADRP
jgi:hypothetical protein